MFKFIAAILVSAIFNCGAILGQLIANPRSYAASTSVKGLSFDYSSAGQAPTVASWTMSQAAANSSKGISLTASAPNPNQGIVSSTTMSTAFAFRAEFQIKLSYSPVTPGDCSLFGFLLVSGIAPPSYPGTNSLTDFLGLSIWLEVCPFGRIYGVYSTSPIASFTPPSSPDASIMLTGCSSCTLGATVPSSIKFELVIVADTLTMAMLPSTDPFFSACFSNIPLTGFSNFVATNPLMVNFVAFNGYSTTMQVPYLRYYLLGSAGYSTISFPKPTPYVMTAPTPSTSLIMDYTLSYSSSTGTYSTDFQYSNAIAPNSTASMTLVNSGVVPQEGGIISSQRMAPGATNFRAELWFTVSSVNLTKSSSYLYFIINDLQGLPLSAAQMTSTGMIPLFRGLMFVLEIGASSDTSNNSLYYSTNLTTNFPLDSTTSCQECLSAQSANLTFVDFTKGTTILTIQMVSDLLSITILPATYQTPLFLFSNYYLPGLGESWANCSNFVQIMQENTDNPMKITMSQTKFWTNANPVTTSSTSTTTSTSATMTTSKYSSMALQNYAKLLNETSGPDFPIPPLLEGHAVPMVTLFDILTCPYIQPNVRAPSDDYSTDIYFTMTIDRLLDIQDIDETISISATLYMQWEVNVCGASYTAANVSETERVLVTDSSDVWHPTVMFANSSNDVYMQSTQYGDDMQILYLPTTPNRTLFFYWTRIGIFTSKCSLELRRFPFDQQTCDFTFSMKEPFDFLNFGGIYLYEPIMSPNNQWRLVSSGKTIGKTPSSVVRNGLSSYAAFQLTFERNPSYQISNLLAPCWVLILLVLVSFLMPPHKPDRPMICCTISLAFVVAQADVLKEVPHTSQNILLAEYILMFTGLTGLVTAYHMIMCGLTRNRQLTMSLISPLGNVEYKMRLVRVLDLAAFLLAFDFLVVINLYAAIIIID